MKSNHFIQIHKDKGMVKNVAGFGFSWMFRFLLDLSWCSLMRRFSCEPGFGFNSCKQIKYWPETSSHHRSSTSPCGRRSRAAEVTCRRQLAALIGRQRSGNDRRSRTLSDQMDVEPRLWIWTQTLQRSEFTCWRAGAGWMTCQPKERGRGLAGLKAPKQLQHLQRRGWKQNFL